MPLGLVLGVALGVVLDVALGVALGVVLDVALGVVLGVVLDVVFVKASAQALRIRVLPTLVTRRFLIR